MEIKVRVLAQYYENYPNADNTPHWKPKGGREFVIGGINPDNLIYDEDSIIARIKLALERYSNDVNRYEFRSVEPLFFDEIDLTEIYNNVGE